MFCATRVRLPLRVFPGLTCLLLMKRKIFDLECCSRPARIRVCACVRTGFGGLLDRPDWQLGTHFWLSARNPALGLVIRPSEPVRKM